MYGGGVGGGGGVVGGGGGAGGGCDGCVAACSGTTTSPGVMAYVGGGGAYTVETNYRYVGAGAGEFSYAKPVRSFSCVGVGVGALLLVLLALFLFFFVFVDPTTTTTPRPISPPGNCLLWGDPHVETFDGGFPNFYGEGEFWMVKSPTVHIQGRYLATQFTNGLAATHQIAVGGPFMNGHTVVVGPMENGEITMDGQSVLKSFPSTLDDPPHGIKLSYTGDGQLVDDAQSHLVKHIVHMELPLGVHLQVMRWANHVNVRITMVAREGGQDGSCGNFNGDPHDDSTAAIKQRIGMRVPQEELLFHAPVQVGPGGQRVTIVDCAQAKRDHAMKICKGSQPEVGGGQLLDSCIFDVCFGGDQYAAQDGLSESQA